MSITYFVVLPFLQGEEGIVPGQAQELPNAPSALRLAEVMSPRSGPVLSDDPAEAACAFHSSGRLVRLTQFTTQPFDKCAAMRNCCRSPRVASRLENPHTVSRFSILVDTMRTMPNETWLVVPYPSTHENNPRFKTRPGTPRPGPFLRYLIRPRRY